MNYNYSYEHFARLGSALRDPVKQLDTARRLLIPATHGWFKDDFDVADVERIAEKAFDNNSVDTKVGLLATALLATATIELNHKNNGDFSERDILAERLALNMRDEFNCRSGMIVLNLLDQLMRNGGTYRNVGLYLAYGVIAAGAPISNEIASLCRTHLHNLGDPRMLDTHELWRDRFDRIRRCGGLSALNESNRISPRDRQRLETLGALNLNF